MRCKSAVLCRACDRDADSESLGNPLTPPPTPAHRTPHPLRYFWRKMFFFSIAQWVSFQSCLSAGSNTVTKPLLQQHYVCRDKSFATTKICLSRQTFCHDEHTFVATSILLRKTRVKIFNKNASVTPNVAW